MTLEEARQLTRVAHEAGLAGDYEQAAALAKRVWEEFGDVDVCWLTPDSVLPYPNLDLYDWPAVKQATKDAIMRTHQSLGKQRFYVEVRGIHTTFVLEVAYRDLKAWDEYEAYLKEKLAHQPADYRERVLQEFRENPQRFPKITRGPSHPPLNPSPPRTVWALARRAAEALEVGVTWVEAEGTALFSKGERVLLVRPGDITATLDGDPFPLEGTPYIHHDRLILPLSALTQAFHITVTPLEQASVHYWLPK
jgi:hypothetical protein